MSTPNTTEGPRRLFVISAPSGAGKSTLAKRVLAARKDLALSVSHTTRAPRPGEEDGVHYHFVDETTFRRLVGEDAFLEWFEVHGNLYGTARAEVDRKMASGYHVLCDVDVQGGAAIRSQRPDAISIFVVPPSLEELERRLRGRGTEPDDVVARRLGNARGELSQAPGYDYVVVNGDLALATEDMLAVLRAAPLERRHQGEIISSLLPE